MHYGNSYVQENVFIVMMLGGLAVVAIIFLALYLLGRSDKIKPSAPSKPRDRPVMPKKNNRKKRNPRK